ncbi:MAG: YggS family pyridoxal phosphate-dependent enzyme [Candidatus Omnitrophota bacterium]|nr:YggS family pyridoxal phosphate-dependent enzyme [Candidatus Omnitrophota bacterium]
MRKKGMAGVKNNVLKILNWLPGYVELVAATKGRSVEEILEAIDSGVRIIGENYVQEAEEKFSVIGPRARWHFIGHLQKNKVKKAVKIFDMIETVDSIEIANEINKACASINKTMPVLIEINSAKEKNKSGVLPLDAETIIKNILGLPNIKLAGLMTMGPLLENPEDYRAYFKETKTLFDKIRINHDIKYLSMGMSGSYHIAIQEGANLVRIGTALFGPR